MKIIQNIVLDVSKRSEFQVVEAKQGDAGSRFVRVTLTKDGEGYILPEGAEARFRCRKPDGHACDNPAAIDEAGTVLLELTEQTLAVAGAVKADLVFTDRQGAVLSTLGFLILVEEAPFGEQLPSASELLSFSELIRKGNQAVADCEAAVDQLDEAVDGAVGGMESRIETLEQQVADLRYVPVAVTGISCEPDMAEMGALVDEVRVVWTLNREPVRQRMDGMPLDRTVREKMLQGLALSENRSFMLEATDEREHTDTGTAELCFCNGVYYGVLAEDTALDDAAVLCLTRKLQSGKTVSFTANAGTGERIAYALPARYGKPVFAVGGFEGGFYKAASFDFTNGAGYQERYDLWLSDNSGLGTTTVNVK